MLAWHIKSQHGVCSGVKMRSLVLVEKTRGLPQGLVEDRCLGQYLFQFP